MATFLKALKRWLAAVGTAIRPSKRRTPRSRPAGEHQKNIYPLW